MKAQSRKVAILIFDEVEVLDFAGPFEIFSVTGKRSNLDPFEVFVVAEELKPVSARNNLNISPHYGISDCPQPDILVVPGGFGTRREMHNDNLIAWIREASVHAELVLSVCTGALLLAKAGLLEDLEATTHHGAVDELKAIAPNTHVDGSKRYIDNGKVILSAGVAAGMDMSLHVVGRLLGDAQAQETADYIEYEWRKVE